MKSLLIVLMLLLPVTGVAACGPPNTGGVASPPEKSPSQGDSPQPGETEGDLLLWISNQSFVDENVGIKVTIDGDPVADRRFAVEGQHNWVDFAVSLPPGKHVLEATSDTGATMTETFRIPADGGPRYAVLDYWNDRDSAVRHFDWRFQREPVAFA